MAPNISTITGDIGGPVTPSAGGNINIYGSSGVSVTGNPLTNTLTITAGSLGTTNHAVQVGTATGLLRSLPGAVDGAVLIGVTGDDPVFSFLSSNDGSVTFTPGAGSLDIDVTNATTIQRGSVLLATNAEVITGANTTKAVTPAGLNAKLGAQAQFSLPIGNGNTNALNWTSLTDGQILIGQTGGAPAAATLTAGAGVSITNGPHSITIAATASGSAWLEETGAAVALLVDTNYIMNRATIITATLPATANIGETIRLVGKGTGLYTIAQNAGQTIHIGIVDSTTGVGGSVTATQRYDCIELVCTVTDTDFTVASLMGNFTVV